MYSSKLPSPIDISDYSNQIEVDQALYRKFVIDLKEQETRPTLLGKFIYINFKHWIDRKSAVFWHLASLNENESFNVLPCTNCISSSLCPNNCNSMERVIDFEDGERRTFCLYRGMRINWISEIIRLANMQDSSIKTWQKVIEKDNTRRIQRFIRFTHEAADYVLIFEEKHKDGQLNFFYFVTAFPVFYINAKRKYQEEYEAYCLSLQTSGH